MPAPTRAGPGCGCGENMGGGVGAPLVGALWEGIRCEGQHVKGWEESTRGAHTSGAGKNPCGGNHTRAGAHDLPLQGMGCGCGKNMGGGVGAPLVGALWEGIRCEGHTRQELGRIHAGGAHQGRHKACIMDPENRTDFEGGT